MLGDNYPVFDRQNKPEDTAKEIIRLNSLENLKKAVKVYGLEGTEDKIKELYKNNKTQKYLLNILHELWKG